MRISRDVPGGVFADVYLDGEQLRECLVADDTEGWAACAFHDAAGKYVIVDGELTTEVRRGAVEIRFAEDHHRQMAEDAQRK